MSQVIRKYNSGGKSPEEPELFEWKDVGKYNKSDLISGLYRNVDTYITNNNLSGKKADAFRTATSRLIDGIKNGTVTLNGDGTFNVSDKSLSSTGQFDKNFLGGEKNTDNNANNRAGDYVLDYIKSMNTYKKPTVAAPKKEKFDFNKYFTGEVSRRWYGGNDIDNDNFFNRRSEEDRLKLMADIAGGITPEMLSGYDLEGTIGADEILNRSKRFVEAINNGTLDNNDYNAFAELGGGGLDRWLKPQEEQTATVDVRGDLRKQWEAEARQKGYTDEAIQAYIDNKQRALEEASQKEVDARNTAQEEKLHADAKAAEEERIRQLGAFNIGNYNTISTLPEVTPYNFEGVYKSRYDNPWSLSFSAYDLNPDKSTQTVPLHREDGSGYYDSVNIGKTVPGTTAAQRLANDSKPHTQWSKADITRMGALAGDVASLLASFTGVGSVASAGIGAASTAANQAADMMEGQSFGKALWNNAGSYVLDAISLIPFAKAAKVPKMIKRVGRFAPLMTTTLAAYQGLSNGGEYIDSWNKVKNGESLTVGDWRNILSSLQLVLGGTAATHRASKAKSHVEAAVTGDEWVKTNQGYRRVSADKMKAIRKAKTLEEQNKILEGTGIVLPEAKTWTGKGKGVAKIPDTDKANMVYDFSKPVTTYSGDLPLQHKFGPGERWLGTAHFPDFHLPGVRDAYNRIIHPQAYKRARVTKKADGGLLIPKFQSPAAPIQRRNVRSADDLSWNNDILNSLGLKNTLGNITPANASKYNNMQGDYAKLGFGTSKPGDTSLTYDPNAAAYQTTFNNLTSVNQDTMSDLVRRGRITGRGGSSDKGTQWTADGLKGDQTFLRHLGTAATTKKGMNVLKSLVPNDIDVIKNLNQGMVNFMPKLKMAGITDGKGFNIPNTPIATTGLLDETVPDVEATPQDIKTTNNSGSYKLNTKGKAATNVLSGLRTLPEDIIALGRMVGGLRANRRAADKYKEGLKPLLVDTYENVVPITGNYLAKVSADKQASNLTSLAARPRTSDGSLQLAGELEAGNRAAQMRFQGDMADADMFNRTRTLAQQESDAAKARRTDVANRNRASMLQINAAKKQIDSARITNNYERVISPYLAGIEGRFRQNRAAGKQFDLEQARLASATKYRPQLQALQDRYLEAQKNNDQEGMKAAMNDYYRLVDAQNQEMLAQRKKLTQMPWLFEQVNPVQAKIPYNKSGAKMNSADRIIMQRARDFNKRMLEDNKQLHKNINESKKQQADLIKHMSSLTAELIKKGMSWK